MIIPIIRHISLFDLLFLIVVIETCCRMHLSSSFLLSPKKISSSSYLHPQLLSNVLNHNDDSNNNVNNKCITESSSYRSHFFSLLSPNNNNNRISTTTSLQQLRRNRGLEINRDGASPQPGGMILYCKAGPDQISIGDCPFAHYIRLVLEEKNLEYDIKPCIQETKPLWLIDYYDGKMPALRHRKECYVESDIIVSYLDFFFPIPTLTYDDNNKDNIIIQQQAEDSINSLFPIIAKYIKHIPDGDETDQVLLDDLQIALEKLNQHFLQNIIIKTDDNNDDSFYLTGSNITLLDCSLAPKLYHMQIACKELKNDVLKIPTTIQKYMDTMFQRESFQKTIYPKETVIWGWTNARK